MIELKCKNCTNWEGSEADTLAKCKIFKVNFYATGTCASCKTAEMTDEDVRKNEEEVEQRLKKKEEEAAKRRQELAKSSTTKTKSKQTTTRKARNKNTFVLVRHDNGRPDLVPFGHQVEAINFYKDKDVIPLFFEMGCGKSFTTLQIAQEKFKQGQIKGLLVIAPNDVHRQWFDELVYGVDKEHDGVMWQELQIDFEAQCVGGRGGQKELYPFETDDLFKFVSVNVDTFSQPTKWEDIVEWANSGNYMIAIDEATSIKNPSSKRSQRLLYEFNDVRRRGKSIVASEKKCPVRAVLTGTPVTNGPIDLWAIMEFVQPNFFGRNYYSFKSYYGMFTKLKVTTSYGSQRDVAVLLTEKTWQGIHNCESYYEAYTLFGCSEDTYMTVKHQSKFVGPYKHADEIKKFLEPVAMFRKLTDCVDMPKVNYIERSVGMSTEQKAIYDSMKKNLLAQYDSYTTTAANKLVVSLRLQQISSGFIMGHKVITDTNWSQFLCEDFGDNFDVSPDEVVWIGESNPKLDALMSDVAECDKPLLILTRYSAEAAKIYDMCKDKYRTGLYTGWKVIGGVDAFKAGELDILVANSTKICKGHNLQIAHTELFYSNSFSMETRQQAEFRTFRLGQKNPCLYVDYTASDCDKNILQALRLKKNLLDYITSEDISMEDML